jgi:hypothetical protein
MRFFIVCLLFPLFSLSQNKTATISGSVIDDEGKPLNGAVVEILNKNKKTTTNATGNFKLVIPSNKLVAITISFNGYITQQRNLQLNEGEEEIINIRLDKTTQQLQEVVVKNDRQTRGEIGRIVIDPNKSILNPSPNNSIENLLKFFTSPTGELTSQYNVRGGSFDENLIYVNDFEVFRPYLIRNGQQEGLSFINPELTSNVKFYNGGFQAKYGDKMSSALDITYRKPKSFGGSAYIGLLEQGLHVEGIAANNKVSYLIGVRNRSNRNLLSSQQTKGNYIPSSSDLQALINYNPNSKWNFELFANTSSTSFTLIPEEAKLTTSVFTPVFSANLGLDIFFQGAEKDEYTTNFIGLSATYQPKKNLKLKWMLSAFSNNERENIDIVGAYLFGDRNFDRGQSSFGLIVNPLGAGVFQNFSRNALEISTITAQHKGSYYKGKHNYEWGNSIERQTINDRLNEWEYNDSAGYSLPYNPNVLNLNKVLKTRFETTITRFSGYFQDNIVLKDSNDFVINIGARYNYNTFNNEFLFSPRLGISFKPKNWKRNVIIKASVGAYHQPPFYRELRRYDGTINTNLKAQRSLQASLGLDYNIKMLGRPARISTELYYKNMTNVVPYDIDNVRVRYFGENSAKAYAVGFETRLYAELVKDAESWLSIGIMQTKEKIDNFFYNNYLNAAGQIITPSTPDQVIKDSQRVDMGYLRRPTDRLISFGFFYQDYLSTNKNFKVYFSGLYGANLPYNIPGSVKYRNALFIDPYIRADIGFSAMLLDGEKQNRRSHSPFRNFESIWLSLEIFNIIDRANTISYLLIKDFQNNTFTIPNRLTPRLLNLKLVARW